MTEIRGLEALNRKLKTLEQFQRKMKKPTQQSLILLQDYIATAPRKKKGAFTAMATDGQRKAYWAKVSAAKKAGHPIHREGVGYKRSDTMSRGWTDGNSIKISTTSNGIRGELGNVKAKAYGRYVQGPFPQWQQPFHKASGWRTIDETIDKNEKKVMKFYDVVVKRELNK